MLMALQYDNMAQLMHAEQGWFRGVHYGLCCRSVLDDLRALWEAKLHEKGLLDNDEPAQPAAANGIPPPAVHSYQAPIAPPPAVSAPG